MPDQTIFVEFKLTDHASPEIARMQESLYRAVLGLPESERPSARPRNRSEMRGVKIHESITDEWT